MTGRFVCDIIKAKPHNHVRFCPNELDPVATSKKLVDSVTLSSTVKDTAFSLMNFDLTV